MSKLLQSELGVCPKIWQKYKICPTHFQENPIKITITERCEGERGIYFKTDTDFCIVKKGRGRYLLLYHKDKNVCPTVHRGNSIKDSFKFTL